MEHASAAHCGLCSQFGKLEHSHIVPKFVYRWLQTSSGSRYLRLRPATDRSGQDGLTSPLLCSACEDRISLWESQFAREVFHPFVADKAVPVKYGPWLLKFAVSVCWRILSDRRVDHAGRWSSEFESCFRTWNDFLLGRRPDVGVHSLHLLRWNSAGDFVGAENLPAMNQYLWRTIEVDVASTENAAFVFAKLGPLMLFGMIRLSSPGEWRETRVHLEGKLKLREVSVPAEYRDYLNRRALRLANWQKSGVAGPAFVNSLVAQGPASDRFTATARD